ncbi:hypothetical protein LP415_09010 [Polaromonas sp. P1(28)-8]|nr:hypothetical protein LP415_09010 [Polaromonas sp. P1(28)-8]
MKQQVRFCTSADGTRIAYIAYAVNGSGQPTRNTGPMRQRRMARASDAPRGVGSSAKNQAG